MKKLVASVCLVFMIGAVGAYAGNHSQLPEPGTTPASPFFGLEQAQESISLALTFNSEKKANKRLRIAQERLSEAKKLSESNDSENAEKAIRMHSRTMERASQNIQDLPEDRRANATRELNRTRNRSVSVLQDLKQRLPESAMKGINTAIEAHRQRGLGNMSEEPGRQGKRPDRNMTDTELDRDLERAVPNSYMATGRVVNSS